MPSGGLIGIPAQETARYTQFAASLAQTDFPDGWEVYFRYGWGVAENINACIEEMVRRDKEWFWTMGDDHAWSPGLLRKLLNRSESLEFVGFDKPKIIVPLCLMRNPPYRPVIWRQSEKAQQIDAWADAKGCGRDSEKVIAIFGELSDAERYDRIDLKDHPDGGLIEVERAGGAGMLIHRTVIDALESNWFDYRGSSKVGEDIHFCERARAAGFKIWCDLDSMLGHCCTSAVWPVREADGWTFAFSMMGGFQVTLPPGFQAYADEVGK